jgi:glucans biosynthesis protein
MSWYGDDDTRPPGGHVTATRHDRGTQDNVDRFLVDFEGGALASLPKDTVLRGVVSAGGREDGAEILEQQVIQNFITGAWRLVFQIRHPASQPVELRAFLQRNDEALSETWAFLLKP